MIIADLQERISQWEASRFPNAPSYLSLIKIQEELGELAGHYIKRLEQREGVIPEDHQAGIEDSVADVLISLCVFCCRENIDLNLMTEQVWAVVSKRKFFITKEGQKHMGK